MLNSNVVALADSGGSKKKVKAADGQYGAMYQGAYTGEEPGNGSISIAAMLGNVTPGGQGGNLGTGAGADQSGFIQALQDALKKKGTAAKTPKTGTPTGGNNFYSPDKTTGTNTNTGGNAGGSSGGSASGDVTDTTETTEETTEGSTTVPEPTLGPLQLGELKTEPTYTNLYNGLKDLQATYDDAMKAYTPKTDEQIRSQAEGEYASYYDQLRLAAQQSADSQDLALQQQRTGLQSSYDKNREASLKQYAQNYSQADRNLLRRGMQRSSYAGQTLANIGTQAAEAQQAIWDEQTAAETNIDQQRTQLAQQLAQQIASYDASQAKDILSRIQSLEDQEYDRGVQAAQQRASLATQIYSYLYQLGRDDIADQEWMLQYLLTGRQQEAGEYQWQKQFNETVREYDQTNGSSSRGGSSGGGGGGSTAKPSTTMADKDTAKTPTTPATAAQQADSPALAFLRGKTSNPTTGDKTTPVGSKTTPGSAGAFLNTLGDFWGNVTDTLYKSLTTKKK